MPEIYVFLRTLRPKRFARRLGLLSLFAMLPLAYLAAQEAARPVSFSFLERPALASAAARGHWLAAAPPDAGLWMLNPALADTSLSGHLALAYNPYYADIRNLQLAYQHSFAGGNHWMLGVQGISYGEFQGYDAAGNPTEPFKAGEYAVSLGRIFQYRYYTFGANLKWVSSRIDQAGAAALLADLGVRLTEPEGRWLAGITVRNLGFRLRSYADVAPPLPLQLTAGISLKPEHAPFRFSFNLHNLQQPFRAYEDPYSPNNKEAVPGVDKLFRHLAVGLDFLPAKAVAIRAGYNHRLRKELRLPDAPGLSGFSLGFAIHTRRLGIDFTRSYAHVTGGKNYLTISSNLSTFLH
jgi:hypothetical protein